MSRSAQGLKQAERDGTVPEITRIRWRLKDNGHGVIDFEFRGSTVTITEPKDVVLADNEASRRWIARGYGFLLVSLPES